MQDLKALVLTPREFLDHRLTTLSTPQELFLKRVTPLAGLRPASELLRSLVSGDITTGFVLGLGSFALQIGTWLGIAMVLPALARQFQTNIDERQAFALTTYASMPFWVAGVLFIAPEEPALLFLWSRLLVTLVAVFALYILHQGLNAMGVEKKAQLPILGATAVVSLLIYTTLWVLFGLTSIAVLFVVGQSVSS